MSFKTTFESPPIPSSHSLKTTYSGRPFMKDMFDLFATLIVSLDLKTHKHYFRSFPNSFSTEEAEQNLASLALTRSNRRPHPDNPSKIVTTITTTKFSMTRHIAHAICQHFMDARLIENATEPASTVFKDRGGIYTLTPKGLHVLEQFMNKNVIVAAAEKLKKVFETQHVCTRLMYVQRRTSDDEMIFSQRVIWVLFKMFVGLQPNYVSTSSSSSSSAAGGGGGGGNVNGSGGGGGGVGGASGHGDRARGVLVHDVVERAQPLMGKSQVQHKSCFYASNALDWLCDFTSAVGRDEAAEIAAQFVRLDLITLVSDKNKNSDESAVTFTVRGATAGGDSVVIQQGEFRCTNTALYKITEEGRRVANWDTTTTTTTTTTTANSSPWSSAVLVNLDNTPSSHQHHQNQNQNQNRQHQPLKSSKPEKVNSMEHNADKLRFILDDAQLKTLFRDFCRSNFCEENLSFYTDVEDFKRKFTNTSSASSAPSTISHHHHHHHHNDNNNNHNNHNNSNSNNNNNNGNGKAPGEEHHDALIQSAFSIYEKYLAISSPCELNMDHRPRNELGRFLEDVVDQADRFNAIHLQTLIKLYERLQVHVFGLMASDSVPKFISSPGFLTMPNNTNEDLESMEEDTLIKTTTFPSSLGEEEDTGRVYFTVSQRASGVGYS